MLQEISGYFSKYNKENFQRLPFKNGYDKALSSHIISGDDFIPLIEEMARKHNEKFIATTVDRFLSMGLITLDQRKSIFTKYQNSFDKNTKNRHILNILYSDDIEAFFMILDTKMTTEEVVDYFEKALKTLLQYDFEKTRDRRLWDFIIDIYLKNEISQDMVSLYKSFYTRLRFSTYCSENIEKILNIFEKTENYKDFKHYVYSNYLVAKGEQFFTDIFQKEFFEKDLMDEAFYMYFIFHIEKYEIALEFLENLKTSSDLTQGKISLYVGLKFDKMEIFQEGLELANRLKNIKHKNLNYTIMYTLKKFIENNNVSELLSILTVPSYHSSLAIQQLYDLASMDDTLDILNSLYKIKNPEILFDIFLTYFKEEKSLSIEDFQESDKLLENCLILFDRYKQAEENEDEESYEMYETLFTQIQEKVVNNELNRQTIEKKLPNFFNANLDRLFDTYLLSNINVNEKNYSIESTLLLKGYSIFYERLEELYTCYLDAKKEEDEELIALIETSFRKMKENLVQENELLTILTENSQIKSKLQIKLSNFHLF